MQSNGIGVECASFYVAWADYYENKGMFAHATELYELGVQQQAQPFETITQMKL